MYYHNNRRQLNRYRYEKYVQVSFGEQVVINGKIRDISEKSAFMDIGNSAYVQKEDILNFKITLSRENPEDVITGQARVSRVADDGFAVFFTEMDEESQKKLLQLISYKKNRNRNGKY